METSGFDGFSLFLYNFAASYAENKKILDIGCGIGRGAALLSERTKGKVQGIDYSKKAITEAAKGIKKHKNLHFSLFDIQQLENLNEKFGLITMFNTLEHFDEFEQRKIMRDICNLMEEGGLCVISTNNKLFTTVANPFHKRELAVEEFYGMMKGAFKNATFWGIKQKFPRGFKKNGARNKCVNSLFRFAFMQEVIQPLIPQRIKDFINTFFLKLPPSQEKDFELCKDLESCDNLLAIGQGPNL